MARRFIPFLLLLLTILTTTATARHPPFHHHHPPPPPHHHHHHHPPPPPHHHHPLPSPHHNHHLPNFTAVLIFGDSTVDTGNNNHVLTSLFKANHLPYGSNFLPTHTPTGRFSDGLLIPDMIASRLSIKPSGTVPAYLDPNLTAHDLKTGVSFASAGTGIDDLTSTMAMGITIEGQVDMFKEYLWNLRHAHGDDVANKTVGRSLMVVSSGTNDFVDNFFDLITRRLQFDLNGYQDFLLGKVEKLVKDLYGLGGRTFFVAGLPPIGCLPVQMTASFQFSLRSRQCIQSQNSDSLSYNVKLKQLLRKLQGSLPGSKMLYANVYDPMLDMVTQPQKYAFVEARKGCCGTGLLEGGFFCSPVMPTCGNMTSQYVFFDSIHPTQKANELLAVNLLHQLASRY
ncbi:GDSL esterase/lipase At2g24560 [Linum perenne]